MKFTDLLLIMFVVLMLLGIGYPRKAHGDDYVTATLTSYHFDRSKNYNERNYGLGYERQFDENWRGHFGFYENSKYRTTVHAFASYSPWRVGDWRAGVMFGPATGYSHTVSVLAGGVLMREWKHFGVNVVVNPAAVGLQVKWSLK